MIYLSSYMIFRELDYRNPGSDPLLESAAQLILRDIYNDNLDTAHPITPVDQLSCILPPVSHDYCLEEDSELLGVGSLDFRAELEDTFLINRVVVVNHRRNQGLGRIIMSELEAVAAGLGKHNINLVAEDEVVGFYKKLGYQTLSEHPLHLNILTKKIFKVA